MTLREFFDTKSLKRGLEMFILGTAGVLNGNDWARPWMTFVILAYLWVRMYMNYRLLIRNNEHARRIPPIGSK